MKETDLLNKISIEPPYFKYNNGIAYEATASLDSIEFTLDDNSTLVTYCTEKLDVSTEFINAVFEILEDRLKLEIENNKLSWYNENR